MSNPKQLNQAIWSIPLPDRLKRLPISDTGYPIPWFVHRDEAGVADFRVIGDDKLVQAIKRKLCWICGQPLGPRMTFAIGPMCSITRRSSEPPCHFRCAEYAAMACPFLSNPRMRRNEKNLDDYLVDPVGLHLDHNPGATCLWTTHSYRIERVGDGILIEIGHPLETHWFAGGHKATREEVLQSIDRGLPSLFERAVAEGFEAVADLQAMIVDAERFLPEAPEARDEA